MYVVSPEFKAAVRTTHEISVRAEVWRGSQRLRSLEILDGAVDVDSRRAQRRTCTVRLAAPKPDVNLIPVFNIYQSLIGYGTYAALAIGYATYAELQSISGYTEETVDDGLIPQTAFSDVTPFGNELRIWRGVKVAAPLHPTYASLMLMGLYSNLIIDFDTYGQMSQSVATDDVFEEVPLGVFVMTEVNVKEDAKDASIEIIGVDRSMRIARSLWVDPVGIVAGTSLSDAIGAVLANRWPDVETDLQSTATTVPALTLGGQGGSSSNPWGDVQKLAEAGGLEVYFNNSGVVVLAAINDPTSKTPLETYVDGEDAMVLDVHRRLSTDQTYNGVVVTGEGTSVIPPVRAILFDEDPASPTYRYGAFGERPAFVSSPLVLTTADAIAVAGAELSKMKGAEENVEWSQICDPSLDAGDVIKIRNEGTRLAKVLVLDKVTIPLSPTGSMKATARTVRVLVEGE